MFHFVSSPPGGYPSLWSHDPSGRYPSLWAHVPSWGHPSLWSHVPSRGYPSLWSHVPSGDPSSGVSSSQGWATPLSRTGVPQPGFGYPLSRTGVPPLPSLGHVMLCGFPQEGFIVILVIEYELRI